MKISELIKGLQYELEANGDCEVMLAVAVLKDVIGSDGKKMGFTMDCEGHITDTIMFNREINTDESVLFLQNFPY